MKLNYIGPHDEVIVPLPTGGQVTATRDGDPVDVPDSHAELLLEQPTNWQRAKRQSAAAKAADEKEKT